MDDNEVNDDAKWTCLMWACVPLVIIVIVLVVGIYLEMN